MTEKFETVIEAKSGWFNLDTRELWKYRDLIYMFVKRDFISRYKQTILGPAWAIIQPLMTTIIFTIVFGKIAQMPTDGVPPFLFYMCGNVTWAFFAGCMTTTASTFVSNAPIFGKVYFPRLTMPIATIFSQGISFLIQLILFIGIYAWHACTGGGVVFSWYLLLYPLLVVQMGILALGVGVIVSALTTKYRDLLMLVAFGTQLWMYASAVVYPMSMIPGKYQWIVLLNPMATIIELSRSAFFGGAAFNWIFYGIGWATTILLFLIGVMLFSRVEKNFVDTI